MMIGRLDKPHSPITIYFKLVPGGFVDITHKFRDSGKVTATYYILDSELKSFVQRRWKDGWRGMFRTKFPDVEFD